jgi:hypothetical protein
METADLYFEIPDPSVAADVMYIRAATAPTNAWIDYYNFKALIVQDDWVVDPWWQYLYALHPFKAGIIKLEANTYYDWHIDTDRNLERADSIANGDVNGKFVELKYKPDTFFLFNAQVAHSVYNFGDTRYLLSLDFVENRHELNYNKLLKEMKDGRWWERE